jgi:hypothetical protein
MRPSLPWMPPSVPSGVVLPPVPSGVTRAAVRAFPTTRPTRAGPPVSHARQWPVASPPAMATDARQNALPGRSHAWTSACRKVTPAWPVARLRSTCAAGCAWTTPRSRAAAVPARVVPRRRPGARPPATARSATSTAALKSAAEPSAANAAPTTTARGRPDSPVHATSPRIAALTPAPAEPRPATVSASPPGTAARTPTARWVLPARSASAIPALANARICARAT